MKRFTSLLALYVAVLMCLGAATVNSIKFFTDYPNSAPVSSDFMLFQRNQSYVNATVSQALGVWFNNPAFTEVEALLEISISVERSPWAGRLSQGSRITVTGLVFQTW